MTTAGHGEDGAAFPGTGPQDECVLAGGELPVGRPDLPSTIIRC